MPAMKRAAAVRANRIVVAKFALGARARRPVHAPSSRNDPKVRDDRADTPAEDRNLLGFRAGFAAEASRRSVFAAPGSETTMPSGSARSRPSPSRPAGPRPVGNRTGRQRPARPRRRARRDLEVEHLTQGGASNVAVAPDPSPPSRSADRARSRETRRHDRDQDVARRGRGRGNHVTGLEPDDALLVDARMLHRQTNVEYVKATAESLPFPSSAFDKVVSMSSVEHFEDPVNGLREMSVCCEPEVGSRSRWTL